MDSKTMEKGVAQLKAIVEPWHESLADPQKAQETVLAGLLQIYSQTAYGKGPPQRQSRFLTRITGKLFRSKPIRNTSR